MTTSVNARTGPTPVEPAVARGSLPFLPEGERRILWMILAAAVALIQLPKLASALVPAGADFHADYFIPDFFQDYASARNVLGGLRPYERHERTLQLYVENGGVIDPGTIKFKVNAHPPASIL